MQCGFGVMAVSSIAFASVPPPTLNPKLYWLDIFSRTLRGFRLALSSHIGGFPKIGDPNIVP